MAGVLKLPPIEGRGWQALLEKTLSVVCENQVEQQLIFLWDEIPYMLQKIHALEQNSRPGNNSALAILDSLREMRSKHENLRMIFTGSVGLHHVLTTLRGEQFASEPINDMTDIDIGPLSQKHATELAQKLFTSNDIQCNEEAAVISCLIKHTDAVPFYMHRIVTKLALIEEKISVDVVEQEINQHLVMSTDPWRMGHFRDRLAIYYKGDVMDADATAIPVAELSKRLLNHLACSALAQSIDDCFAALKAELRIQQRDIVTNLLDSLAKDHYLIRDASGKYRFCFPLVQRWWVLAEGLN